MSATLDEFAATEDSDNETPPWCERNDAEEWCQSHREKGEIGCFDHFGGDSA